MDRKTFNGIKRINGAHFLMDKGTPDILDKLSDADNARIAKKHGFNRVWPPTSKSSAWPLTRITSCQYRKKQPVFGAMQTSFTDAPRELAVNTGPLHPVNQMAVEPSLVSTMHPVMRLMGGKRARPFGFGPDRTLNPSTTGHSASPMNQQFMSRLHGRGFGVKD